MYTGRIHHACSKVHNMLLAQMQPELKVRDGVM
jgi:hypothetical protein